jgi:hypothetical protein
VSGGPGVEADALPSDEDLEEFASLGAEGAAPEEDAPSGRDVRERVVVRLSDIQYSDEVTDAILGALASTRSVFRRGGNLVAVRGWNAAESSAAWRLASMPRMGTDGPLLPTLALREGAPVIRSVRGGALDHLVSRHVECQVYKRPPGRPASGKTPEGRWVRIDCPGRILAQVAGVGGDAVLPPLEGILQVPSLRPDGSVIDRAGYDDATGYYLASSMALPHLRERPDIDSAKRALVCLQDLFAPTEGERFGFPWRSGMAETVVPIALLMTIIARPALGCVPAFVIDASTPGAGKGKVIGVVSVIATGDEPARAGWPNSPEEQEKTLGAYAAMGPALIAWDNVRGNIANPHLENALTTPIYAFRVLGVSEMLPLPFRSVATFTGNNIVLGGDMPRRCIVGRLEPSTEHPERIPEDRFRHPHIEAKARRDRAKYVAAALTILRAYVLAGAPDQGLRFSFSEWVRLVGGALAWCGAGDVTAFSGKENVTEPEEWSAARALLGAWPRLDPAGAGISLSSALALLYPSTVVEAIRKGERPAPDGWEAERQAVQHLARCPDRAVPDAHKLGNGLKFALGRWFESSGAMRRFVHATTSAGAPYVPSRWRVESM